MKTHSDPGRLRLRRALLPLLLATGSATAGVQVCELAGEPINPANGNELAGKSGLMRCVDSDTGERIREQELVDGRFEGWARRFEAGVLQREEQRNAQGNRHGLVREYAGRGADNPLVLEQTYDNGNLRGIARSWHPAGGLKRVAFHDDSGRELAHAEFNAGGQLTRLRCAERSVLAPHADDAAWCGHRSGAGRPVVIFADDGSRRSELSHRGGELIESRSFGPDGSLRQHERVEGGQIRRIEYRPDGTRSSETLWQGQGTAREKILERSYSEQDRPASERRWSAGLLSEEQEWYLNGQPRQRLQYRPQDESSHILESRYHDNGALAYEGEYQMSGQYRRSARGVHRRLDAEGTLREELHYDDAGRLHRRRSFDEAGQLEKDEEVFADGSRRTFQPD